MTRQIYAYPDKFKKLRLQLWYWYLKETLYKRKQGKELRTTEKRSKDIVMFYWERRIFFSGFLAFVNFFFQFNLTFNIWNVAQKAQIFVWYFWYKVLLFFTKYPWKILWKYLDFFFVKTQEEPWIFFSQSPKVRLLRDCVCLLKNFFRTIFF